MKQKFALLLMICFSIVVLSGCDRGELYTEQAPDLQPVVAEYYEELGISDKAYRNAKTVYKSFQVNEEKSLTFRLPDYWLEIYVYGVAENAVIVREKYSTFAALPLDGGYLWGVHAVTHANYAAHFLDDFSMACLEQIGYNAEIIGVDDEYVYLISSPSDVQYDCQDELAVALYQTHWNTKSMFVSDFLRVNEIRPITTVSQ